MSVGKRHKPIRNKPARYFPRMILRSDIGLVANNSIVPDCISSAKNLMVIAGITKVKIVGAK